MPNFYNFVNKGEQEADLYITGDIVDNDEQWLYDYFQEDCAAPKKFKEELDKHNGKKINVIIDSCGGSVFAASTIYTYLKCHKGGVICKVSGIAASAASVIAMAGDKLLMSPTSVLMIHNPLTFACGMYNQNDLRKSADILDGIKESIINAYERKTHLDRKTISKLMDEEKWMDCNEAKELGFCDGVWGEEESNVGLFNKATLENIKNQRIAVFNCLSAKLQNKSVPPVEDNNKQVNKEHKKNPAETQIDDEAEMLELRKRVALLQRF